MDTYSNHDLMKLIQSTNDINREYCNFHDTMFKQKAGQNYNYSFAALSLNDLKVQLTSLTENLLKLKKELQPANYQLIDTLLAYQELLGQRISLLQNISARLALKAEYSEDDNHYSFIAYRKDIKRLESLEKKTKELGGNLQALAVPFMSYNRRQNDVDYISGLEQEMRYMRPAFFVTKRGLKVRLDHDYCEAFLVDGLFKHNGENKKVTTWHNSIDAWVAFAPFLSIILATILAILHVDPIRFCISVSVVLLIGKVCSQSTICIKALNWLCYSIGVVYFVISKLFIQYIAFVVVTLVYKEYWLLLAYFIVRVICFAVCSWVSMVKGKALNVRYGIVFTDIEITAVKLLLYYSSESSPYNQWISEYSDHIQSGETI